MTVEIPENVADCLESFMSGDHVYVVFVKSREEGLGPLNKRARTHFQAALNDISTHARERVLIADIVCRGRVDRDGGTRSDLPKVWVWKPRRAQPDDVEYLIVGYEVL